MSSITSMMPQGPSPASQQLGGTGELQQLLQQMTPEQRQSLLGLGTADEQQAINQHSLAQSEAMRKQLAGGHSYGLGAGIGNGLAEVLEGINSHIQRGNEEGVLAGQRSDRNSLLQLLQGQQGQPDLASLRGAAATQGGVPFGF